MRKTFRYSDQLCSWSNGLCHKNIAVSGQFYVRLLLYSAFTQTQNTRVQLWRKYFKIPKISPGAYIFQRPFLGGLFLEGPIFGGAYVGREICVSKSIGLACSGKEIYHFCLCIWGQIPSTSPPGGLYFEERFNGGFFSITIWGAYIWKGLDLEGLIFGILRYNTSFIKEL